MIFVGKVLTSSTGTATSNEVTGLGAELVAAYVLIKSGSGNITFNLEGSIDDTNWDVCASSGTVSAATGFKYIFKPALSVYRKYRINMTSNASDTVDGYLAMSGHERSDYTM